MLMVGYQGFISRCQRETDKQLHLLAIRPNNGPSLDEDEIVSFGRYDTSVCCSKTIDI